MSDQELTIPQKFKKWGYTFSLIKRGRYKVIYEQKHGSGYVVAYEVHKIRLNRLESGNKDRSGIVTRSECAGYTGKLATTSEFGTHGWSFNTLKRAEERFNELSDSL